MILENGGGGNNDFPTMAGVMRNGGNQALIRREKWHFEA